MNETLKSNMSNAAVAGAQTDLGGVRKITRAELYRWCDVAGISTGGYMSGGGSIQYVEHPWAVLASSLCYAFGIAREEAEEIAGHVKTLTTRSAKTEDAGTRGPINYSLTSGLCPVKGGCFVLVQYVVLSREPVSFGDIQPEKLKHIAIMISVLAKLVLENVNMLVPASNIGTDSHAEFIRGFFENHGVGVPDELTLQEQKDKDIIRPIALSVKGTIPGLAFVSQPD